MYDAIEKLSGEEQKQEREEGKGEGGERNQGAWQRRVLSDGETERKGGSEN
jgi:hypothetical protein